MAYNPNASKHLAYRYGYCVNEKCEKSKRDAKGNHIVQQLASHKPFVCEDCGKALHECPPPKQSKFNGKLLGIIAAAVLVLGGGGFGIYKALSGGTDYSKVKLSLDQKELVLQPGERKQLTPAVEPADAKATYTWKSTDETVATVKSGVVTAVKEGEATIVLSIEEDNTKKVRCNVKVAVPEDTLGPKPPVLIENMNFTQPKLALSVGERATLNLVVSPEQNDESLTIASSDEKVVVVDDGGTVKGVKAGTATVTVTSSISAKQASVEVTVKGKEETGGSTTGGNPKYGTVDLGYASYTGDLKNGKPHGHGTMKFKSSHRINSEYTAERGDTYEGDFRDGRIAGGIGYLNHNGNVIQLNP